MGTMPGVTVIAVARVASTATYQNSQFILFHKSYRHPPRQRMPQQRDDARDGETYHHEREHQRHREGRRGQSRQ
jgi:hypothetical protein